MSPQYNFSKDPFCSLFTGEDLKGVLRTTGKVKGIIGGVVPSLEDLAAFVQNIYPILGEGDPSQPLYTIPNPSFLPRDLSPNPTTDDPIVTVDIGGTNLRITWEHENEIREFKQPIQDFFEHAEDLKDAIEKICLQIEKLDPERAANRFGVIYSFPQKNYQIPNGVGAKVVGSDAVQKGRIFSGEINDGFGLDQALNHNLASLGFKVDVLVITNDTNAGLYSVQNANTAVVLSSGANALLPWGEEAPRNGEIGAYIELPEYLQSPITSEIARIRKEAGEGICSFESVIGGNFLPFELADHIRALAPKLGNFNNKEFLTWYMVSAQRRGADLVLTLADTVEESKWYRLRKVDPWLHEILAPSFSSENGLWSQLSILSESLVKRSAYFGAAMIALSAEGLLRSSEGDVVVALDSSLARSSGSYLWDLELMTHRLTGGRVKIELCSNEPYSPPTQGLKRLLRHYPID